MDKKRRKRTVTTRPTHDSCRTCRFRRVKCDATRPVCQRCLDAGRACGGYASWTVDLPSRDLAKADVLPPSGSSSDAGSSSIKDEYDKSDDFDLSDYSESSQKDEKWSFTRFDQTDQKWATEKAIVPISQYQNVHPALPPLYVIDNSLLRDQQIFAIFAEAHSNPAQKASSHERVLNMIVADHARSPLVGKTLRALSWAYASSVEHKNKQVLQAARASYGNAMVAVSSKLNAIQSGQECGETSLAMLTSIQMLGLYQDSSQRFSNRPQPGWQIHIRGAQEYAKSCGSMARGWGEHLVAIWFMGFAMDLAKRRAGPLDLRDWRSSPVQRQSGGVPIDRFFPIVLPLPGLLQAVDRILLVPPTSLAPTGHKKLLDLVYKIDCVRNDIVDWLDQIIPWQLITVSKSNLDPKLEEHQVLLSNRTFPTQYSYLAPTPKFKMYAVFSQIICLIADCALLRLSEHFAPVENILTQTAIVRNVEEDAFRMACGLCQDVYSLSIMNSVLYALLLRTSTQVAATFFTDYGALRELEFCTQCGEATDLRLARLREDHARTLCRIVDVAPMLVEGAKYRSHR